MDRLLRVDMLSVTGMFTITMYLHIILRDVHRLHDVCRLPLGSPYPALVMLPCPDSATLATRVSALASYARGVLYGIWSCFDSVRLYIRIQIDIECPGHVIEISM